LTELEKINKQEGYTRGRGKGEWAEQIKILKSAKEQKIRPGRYQTDIDTDP